MINKPYLERKSPSRPVSVILSALLTLPLFVGCGGKSQSDLPSADNNQRVTNSSAPAAAPAKKKGLTNVQKAGITLAGAAALYYLYNKNKNKQAEGAQGKYYLSKNGRVYYRDAQKRVHWVTPPQGGIQVPPEEAARYKEFQGYNNRSTGRDLTGLPEAQGTY